MASVMEYHLELFITGPPIRQVLFCSLSSVVIICNAASGRSERVGGRPLLGQAHRWSGDRHGTAGQYGYVPSGRHLV